MIAVLRRRSRAVAATFLVLVAGSTLLGSPAGAQVDSTGGTGGESELAGYTGRAATSGLHEFYNPEGLLPTAPPVDFGSPDALATIASGPSTYARASVADPGDLLANPEALLAQASPDYPAGTVPAYPYRVEANSGVGEPRAESNPAPGLNASVESLGDSSRARAATPAALAPGIAEIGSITSESTTKLGTSSLTVHAHTEMSGFSLLNIVGIKSLVTDVTATSDGGTTKLSGGTTITGATVLGKPVTIDAQGVHADPKAQPTAPGIGALTGALQGSPQEILTRAGIRVTLLGPVQQSKGTSGQLATTGLRIDLEVSNATYPQLTQLANLVPPIESPAPGAPSPGDVLQVLKARHIVSLELGRALVSLTARKAIPVDDSAFVDVGGSTGIDTGALGVTGDLTTGVGSDLPAVTRPAAGVVPGGPDLSDATPIGSVGAGVGALALLALLAQPLLGSQVAKAASALLGGEDADHCLREER